MAGAKKALGEITLGRDKDIRIRYAKKADFIELQNVGKVIKTKYIPDTVLYLIHNYRKDQQLIKQLQARNTQLNAAISKLAAQQEGSKKLLSQFIKYTDQFNAMTISRAKAILKKIGGAQSRRR